VSRRLLTLAAVASAALLVPAAAWAHAALLKTFPAASAEVDTPPAEVRLVYDEAVEPRFAIISVTDAAAHQEVDGSVHRSATNVDEIDVPLKRVREGWYLVFWRVISVDGHPVRGAFTFKVGPNPGPPPQFVVPSLSETATTPGLLTFRWLTFLSFMTALGLFVLRMVIARPVVARVSGTRLRAISVAFWIALGVALVAEAGVALQRIQRYRGVFAPGGLGELVDGIGAPAPPVQIGAKFAHEAVGGRRRLQRGEELLSVLLFEQRQQRRVALDQAREVPEVASCLDGERLEALEYLVGLVLLGRMEGLVVEVGEPGGGDEDEVDAAVDGPAVDVVGELLVELGDEGIVRHG